MILVDTSVWVDHFRRGDETLKRMLSDGQVYTHPFVIGELALGGLRQQDAIVTLLSNLAHATPARDDEVLGFIRRHALAGQGIGYIDAHLLASARLSSLRLWTHDKRLHIAAHTLGLASA